MAAEAPAETQPGEDMLCGKWGDGLQGGSKGGVQSGVTAEVAARPGYRHCVCQVYVLGLAMARKCMCWDLRWCCVLVS